MPHYFKCATMHIFKIRFLPEHPKLANKACNWKPLLQLAYFGNPAEFYSLGFIWITGIKNQTKCIDWKFGGRLSILGFSESGNCCIGFGKPANQQNSIMENWQALPVFHFQALLQKTTCHFACKRVLSNAQRLHYTSDAQPWWRGRHTPSI